MARAMELTGSPTYRHHEVVAVPRSPLYQAYQVLHWGFCAVPVIAGLDKFAHLLVNWNQYLAPRIGNAIEAYTPMTSGQFMMGVGVVEVLAGLLVALRPRIGGYVVAAWLMAIIGNLIVGMHYFDVALRDFGLMVGAIALGRLGRHFDGAHKARDLDDDGDIEITERKRPMWRHRDDDVVRD